MSSKVYFIKAAVSEGEQRISEKTLNLFRAANLASRFKENDFTAVKIHTGEHGNQTYIRPGCIKGVVDELKKLKTKPFLTDTSTLYTLRRHNAIDHCILADEHGFNVQTLGVPFIPTDGLFGTAETEVEINCPVNKEVSIAADIVRCQSILSIAHFTGHIATCAAATLKTLGMGCASRKGKMRQHSALKPKVNPDKCTSCGQCIEYCPEDAIDIDKLKAHIDQDKCIGCAECVAVCRFEAVEYDWDIVNEDLQINIAEHALGALKGKEKRAAFVTFIISVAKECDCFDTELPTIVDDIGIVASTDPVAIDKAALDLVEQYGGKTLQSLIEKERLDPRFQLEHAQKIGLGNLDYELIEIK